MSLAAFLTISAAILILVYAYLYLRSCFGYWRSLGVASTSPAPFNVFGDIGAALLGLTNVAFVHQRIYQEFPAQSCVGMYEFGAPALLVRDPQLVAAVLAKDFGHFGHRFAEAAPVTALDFHLFVLNGQQWKDVRRRLVRIFSDANIKAMFPMVDNCATVLQSIIREKIANSEPFDAKEIAARFAVDVIGHCMFGLQFNTLNDPESQFRKIGKLMLAPNVRIPLLQLLRFFAPAFLQKFHISENPPEMLPFFQHLLEQNWKIRRGASAATQTNDLMQTLLDIYDDPEQMADVASVPDGFNFNQAVALSNTFIFYAASFETTSATISYCLLELALNPQIQRQLRREIRATIDNGEIQYENLKKIEFLEMVLKETLRKYSPAPFLNRVCTKAYQLPGTSIIIPAGTRITIPVYAIHRDERFYPNPEEFDPKRFTPENIAARPQFTYLPFGEGFRKCIAYRFDKMEIMLCLARLVLRYNFTTCDKTILPVRTEPRSFLKVPKDGIFLTATEITD